MKYPFIVAELSGNHNGRLYRAIELIDVAKAAGADAVKFQTYTPESMVADEGYVVPSGPWAGKRLIDLYREAATPYEWHKDLFQYAAKRGIVAFSTPFSEADVDFLETLNCPIYKIASFEMIDFNLLRYVARTKKPMIVSTGMATFQEIGNAVNEIRKANPDVDLTLLKCTSAYPASYADANIHTMVYLRQVYQCRVGISDHSLTTTVCTIAAAFGASVFEKHLCFSRQEDGPDSKFSIEPNEFLETVADIYAARKSLGQIQEGPNASETDSLALRRSLYAARDIAEGAIIQAEDIKCARPNLGCHPGYFWDIVGLPAVHTIKKGEPLKIMPASFPGPRT